MTNAARFSGFVALLALLGLETACYPVMEYHKNPPGSVLSVSQGITLAYIEFDDNGEMYEHPAGDGTLQRTELDAAIRGIKNVEAASPKGINVVVFIHGWKNNADNTVDVAGFQDLLKDIYKYSDSTPLVGIYIGWRGATWKVARELTYFNRSAAAVRVAGTHLEEALYRIMLTVKPVVPVRDTQGSGVHMEMEEGAHSNLILIGHSFGGRVLEKAITPYLEGVMLVADKGHLSGCSGGGPPVRVYAPLPDLIVLLNEAAPATDAKQFLEFLKCHGVTYQRNDPGFGSTPVNYPLYLSVTSEGDAATSIALPIGQTAARMQLKTRQYDTPDPPEIPNQSTYFTHSTANIPALHSHELQTADCGDRTVHLSLSVTNPFDKLNLCAVPDAAHKIPGMAYWNHTPYWVTKIPVSIVPDHSNIFRPELYEFLKFFLPSKSSLQDPKKTAQSEGRRTSSQILMMN